MKLCPLCNKTDLSPLYSDIEKNCRIYEVLYCPACQTGITKPFPDKEELDALYSSETYRAHDKRFIGPIEGIIKSFRGFRLRSIERYSHNKGSILDIGCGRGLFLSLAKERGWMPYGVELNEETAYNAKEVLGMDIRTGELKDAGFEEGSIDVISIWHVLEHLTRPIEALRECRRILRPNGLLVLSVPNLSSIQSHSSGKHWFHLDVPYHLYHFSKEGIIKLLEESGFKILDIGHYSCEYGPFGMLQSILNKAGIRHNLLYDTLKTKDIRGGLRRHLKDYVIMASSMPFVFITSIILTIIESLMGKGGSIEIYAKKT